MHPFAQLVHKAVEKLEVRVHVDIDLDIYIDTVSRVSNVHDVATDDGVYVE